MYDHYIQGMAKSLAAAGLVQDTNQAQAVLAKHWSDKIAIVWSLEDVKLAMANFNETTKAAVSDDTAREVLQAIFKNYDCNIGINWDVIHTTIWNLSDSKHDKPPSKSW